MKACTVSLVSNLSARPDPDRERAIRPILHDPEHLADVLDHVHALARYIEGGGAVAWWTGYARGPNGKIDVCFRVMGDEYRDTAASVRRERASRAEAVPPPGQGAVTQAATWP